jgi:hypothetical protein
MKDLRIGGYFDQKYIISHDMCCLSAAINKENPEKRQQN